MYCNNPYNYANMLANQASPMPNVTQQTTANMPYQAAANMPYQATANMPHHAKQPVMPMAGAGLPMTATMQPPPTSITGMTGMPPIPTVDFPGTAGTMPTGIGAMPLTSGAGPLDFQALTQTPIMDIEYTQGYLRTQIGQRVKVEFLIGTNMFMDREGTLLDVGVSYIIIQEVDTDDHLLCDIYSIKFVRFYY